MPVRDIPAALRDEFGKNMRIPEKTVINDYLLENDLRIVKLLRKPLVSSKNIKKRIEFARNNLENIDDLVFKTIWSDETTVRKMPQGKDIRIRCHGSINKEDLPVNQQIQAGGFSVMFWGCFSILGTGPLIALEGTQNQHTYVKLLKDYLIPEIYTAKHDFGIEMTFMHDNAPCHKTNLVTRYLKRKKVTTLDWPPQSPDLNPIENLWAIIKKRRQKKYGFPQSKEDLIEQVFKIWEDLDENLLQKLGKSMEKRLNEVLRLSGRSTKY
jgi:transposase